MKTNAVVFPKADAYEIRELTLPDPGPGDVRVRTLVSAISPGTERWILRGKHVGTEFPCVPGYQRIGVVETCGKDVKNLEPGDVVHGSAGSWKETEVVSMWAAHVGHSVAPADGYRFLASTMPNQLELEALSFMMLIGVANRGINAIDIASGQKLLTIGAGIVGLCAAQLAALRGALGIVVDKDPARVAFAASLGIAALASDDPDFDAKLNALAPDGLDMLHDTVGHAATTDRLVQKVKRGGTLLLQAQYFDKAACAINLDQIKIQELTTKTTCGMGDRDLFETHTNILTRRLRVAPLITHRFAAPTELLKGYALLDKGEEFNMGIVFNWS